jgi:HKD family nuclease
MITILTRTQNLRAILGEYRNTRIDIVVAFASKSEDLVDEMIKNNNKVSIIVGTINNFTDPSFIEYCQDLDKKKLDIYVDFRNNESVHWKLYLISPTTVIIRYYHDLFTERWPGTQTEPKVV